jgi:SH3-like domain-containing protein
MTVEINPKNKSTRFKQEAMHVLQFYLNAGTDLEIMKEIEQWMNRDLTGVPSFDYDFIRKGEDNTLITFE